MTEVEQLVSRARRARLVWKVAIGVVVLSAFAGLGGAIVANIVNGQQDTKIERISACEEDPEGELCQDTKLKSDRHRTVSSACVLFYKVDRNGQLLELTKCPVRHGQIGSSSESAGGDAEQTPHQGNQQPGPSGGQQNPSSPHNGGSESSPAPGGSGSEEGAAPPPEEHPASEAQPGSTHPVGEAVEGVVESVTGLVPEAVCSLPVALCP